MIENNQDKPMNNREFAEKSEKFTKDCNSVEVKPTKRQASKYRRGFGTVFNRVYLHKNK